ncbi:hypothetical protein HPB48_013801 [Haemaphysalis longicornis]|uniref:ISXO2-like transposase domain-containing protein n=1 Tax=Haemaphysalis longicornis TaxID=44386 RepID=A0A9J6GTK9_HAELO|nr:hypothetical protein HPB48_013801 [Haemaphysalis longicornis]
MSISFCRRAHAQEVAARLLRTPHSLRNMRDVSTGVIPVGAMGSPLSVIFLHQVLSPLVGKTSTHVKNAGQFVEVVSDVPIDHGDRLVSFDVVLLFTSVTVSLAIATATAALENDDSLGSRTCSPSNNGYWDICKDHKFNPSFPDCVGQVVTYQRKSAKGHRPQFRCSGCRKPLSQLNRSNVLRGLPGQGSFFAFTDRLGRPNVWLTRKEIMWLAFSLCKDMPVALTKELMRGEFALSKKVLTDWRNLLREVVQEELRARPLLGGPNQVVEVNECLMRGKRKGNSGRLLTGDGVTRSAVDKGPWVFGMVCVETKELRLFKVDAWDAVTLGEKITQNIAPGTTIHSDEWAAYNCIHNLVDAAGSSMNYVWKTVNHTKNFVDPNTGTDIQNIESF